MDSFQRYTITAALPYANGPVHIGHLAGVYVPADIYARYLRLKGKDVLFVCGSDEHGVPITIRARKENTTPQVVVDKYHQLIRDSFKKFGISFDIYSRTSSKIHHQTSGDFFRQLFEKDILEEKTSAQFYDEQEGQFLADRYIVGTCPNCKFENAYGDQCENCGTSLSPSDLINPRSMLSGNPPVLRETRHWYLPLQNYEEWLRKWILEDHQEWKSNVYGQCKSWLDQGLQPRAVTRDLEWGVPVPLQGAEGKVLYVWFDAPIGYISATKDWAEQNHKNWQPYWKSKDTKLVHFIGKDNIVFHCIIFPVMLKSHGSFILPDNVPANEFLNLENSKISTSRNWAVWLHEYLEDFSGKEDVLRYALTANAPETKDNNFTWKDFQDRNNNELVAIFGNFVNRAMVLTHKFFGGKIPPQHRIFQIEKDLIDKLRRIPGMIEDSLEQYRFREALGHLMEVARIGNKYLADTEPWKLIKEDPDRVGTILNLSLQIVANLAVLSEPFMPHTAARIRQMLRKEGFTWDEGGKVYILNEGHMLGDAELLFEKLDDAVVETQVAKLTKNKAEQAVEANEVKSEVEFDEFTRMELKVATILEAQKVENSKKLLKLLLDTGNGTRTVVSGIAEHYQPEQVIGRQVCLLANLKPRKIMGIESKGMILMARDNDGKLAFMMPDQLVNNGSEIS